MDMCKGTAETASAFGRSSNGIPGGEAGTGTAAAADATTRAVATEEVTGGSGESGFRIAEETIYHGARRDFFLGAHRLAMFLAIIFGASAATAVGNEKLCGLLAAVAASADIAFDFVGRAQAHADVRRRYLDLGANMETGQVARENFLAEWMKISADEPPLYRWVAEIAHRNARIAFGEEAPAQLPLWQRALAHVWRG